MDNRFIPPSLPPCYGSNFFQPFLLFEAPISNIVVYFLVLDVGVENKNQSKIILEWSSIELVFSLFWPLRLITLASEMKPCITVNTIFHHIYVVQKIYILKYYYESYSSFCAKSVLQMHNFLQILPLILHFKLISYKSSKIKAYNVTKLCTNLHKCE